GGETGGCVRATRRLRGRAGPRRAVQAVSGGGEGRPAGRRRRGGEGGGRSAGRSRGTGPAGGTGPCAGRGRAGEDRGRGPRAAEAATSATGPGVCGASALGRWRSVRVVAGPANGRTTAPVRPQRGTDRGV